MARPRKPYADPVTETTGGRVSWYPSGLVTEYADRITRRIANPAERRAFIAAKRAELLELRGTGLAVPAEQIPGPHRTIADTCDAFIEDLRQKEAPKGTTNKYESTLRTWVKPTIGGNVGTDLGTITLYKAPLEAAFSAGLAPNTVNGVATALGALATWAIEDWWPPNPFGDERARSGYLKELRRRVRRAQTDAAAAASATEERPKIHVDDDGDDDSGIKLAACPTWTNVEALTRAITDRESVGNPHRTRRQRKTDLITVDVAAHAAAIIEVQAATGLRMCEALALHTSRIDVAAGRIRVDRQLDRYKPWEPGQPPPLRGPKHGRKRTTQCLTFYLPKLRRLCERADERNGGWLFPPTRDQRWWADAFGAMVARGIELLHDDIAAGKLDAADAWIWRPHYTRHFYGSICLTPEQSGGFGLDLAHISACMGHADTATTARIYIHPGRDAEKHMREVTRRIPR